MGSQKIGRTKDLLFLWWYAADLCLSKCVFWLDFHFFEYEIELKVHIHYISLHQGMKQRLARWKSKCNSRKIRVSMTVDYLKRENFYMAEYTSKSKDKQYTRRKYLQYMSQIKG